MGKNHTDRPRSIAIAIGVIALALLGHWGLEQRPERRALRDYKDEIAPFFERAEASQAGLEKFKRKLLRDSRNHSAKSVPDYAKANYETADMIGMDDGRNDDTKYY